MLHVDIIYLAKRGQKLVSIWQHLQRCLLTSHVRLWGYWWGWGGHLTVPKLRFRNKESLHYRKTAVFFILKKKSYCPQPGYNRPLVTLTCHRRRLKGTVLRMRPQNRGPVSQQVWHDKDPYSEAVGTEHMSIIFSTDKQTNDSWVDT